MSASSPTPAPAGVAEPVAAPLSSDAPTVEVPAADIPGAGDAGALQVPGTPVAPSTDQEGFAPSPETESLRVLLYSSDRTVREQVHLALGRRIAPDLPPVEIFDTATQPAVLAALARGGHDVIVLDGEATPAGGFGIAHQVKDEIVNCPPVVLLVARRDDAWLATWSRAEGVSSYPVDPLRLPRTVAEVVRATRSRGGRREPVGSAAGTVTA